MPFSAATPLNPAVHPGSRRQNIFGAHSPSLTASVDSLIASLARGRTSRCRVTEGERAQSMAIEIAALCSNSHVMLELHNGVPMAGCACSCP